MYMYVGTVSNWVKLSCARSGKLTFSVCYIHNKTLVEINSSLVGQLSANHLLQTVQHNMFKRLAK